MATLNGFDATQVEPTTSFDPLPAGKYLAAITESVVKPIKTADGNYLELTFEVVEGEFRGRKLWDRRRRRDLDNIQKCTLDALQHAGVYEDDSLVDVLLARRCTVDPPGRLEIQIESLPLRRCLLCGHPLTGREMEHPHDN